MRIDSLILIGPPTPSLEGLATANCLQHFNANYFYYTYIDPVVSTAPSPPISFTQHNLDDNNRKMLSDLFQERVTSPSTSQLTTFREVLKLATILTLSDNKSIFLDSSTVTTKPIHLFTEKGFIRIFASKNYHLPYYHTIDNLLKLDRRATFSFLPNLFPFTRELSQLFIGYIETRHKKSWQQSLLDNVDFNHPDSFSATETLGTFMLSVLGSKITPIFDKHASISVPDLPNSIAKPFVRVQITNQKPYDALSIETISFSQYAKSIQRKLLDYARIPWRLLRVRKVLNLLCGTKQPLNNHRVLSDFLSARFQNTSDLNVVQVGANDGVQNDPLRPFLITPNSYKALLVEPLSNYLEDLHALYGSRKDVKLLNAAVGSQSGTLTLYHIPREIALQMNGDGPQNNWALGQGSFSKSTVVFWIHQNCFRGEAYRERLNEWIDSIEETTVPMVTTDSLIDDDPNNTLVVIDVQGYESEVVRGLDKSRLPRWIVIEEDTDDPTARRLLLSLGYELLSSGPNLIFEHPLG
jgi:FkbM family methyltransferase